MELNRRSESEVVGKSYYPDLGGCIPPPWDYVPGILDESSSVPCLKGNGFSEESSFIEEASQVWGNSSLSKMTNSGQ
jgi:hypothetical protein